MNINSDYKWLNSSCSIYLKQHTAFTKQRYVIQFALQFINIVVNLLDALKTSFSHRSMAARSLGKKDSVSEAAVAGLSLLKVWINTVSTRRSLPASIQNHNPRKNIWTY